MNEKGSPEVYAAAGALLGGIVTKLGSVLIRRQFSESAQIRKELREELTLLRSEMKAMSGEIDLWKGKYYELTSENLKLMHECRRLEQEISALKTELGRRPEGSRTH